MIRYFLYKSDKPDKQVRFELVKELEKEEVIPDNNENCYYVVVSLVQRETDKHILTDYFVGNNLFVSSQKIKRS